MRQHANCLEADAPARSVEWLPLSDLESERAHAASAAPAGSTYASIRVAVGHAVSGPHPESHNPALDARGIGDPALLQGVFGVAGVWFGFGFGFGFGFRVWVWVRVRVGVGVRV